MHSLSRWAVVCALGASLSIRAAPAAAQQDEARAVYLQGAQAFAAGQFRPALVAFQRAFEVTGDSAILFNIGVTWERLGEPGEAARTLRRYLVAVPNPPNRVEIEQRIEALDHADSQLHPASSAAGTSGSATPIAVRANEQSHEAPATQPSGGVPIVPWIGAGLGAVAAFSGLALSLTADSHIDDANRATDERSRQSAIDAAHTQQITGIVVSAVGVVGVAAGVFLALRSGHSDSPPRAWLDVVPSAGGAVFQVGVRVPWF